MDNEFSIKVPESVRLDIEEERNNELCCKVLKSGSSYTAEETTTDDSAQWSQTEVAAGQEVHVNKHAQCVELSTFEVNNVKEIETLKENQAELFKVEPTEEKYKGYCYLRKRKTIVAVLLLSLLITFSVSGTFLPDVFRYIVKKLVVLRKGDVLYKEWMSPTLPCYMTFSIFNYTNIDDILTHRSKPKVSEIGPFTYRAIYVKDVLDYNRYNLTYLQHNTFFFEPSLSCALCRENATVFTPSISLLTLMKLIPDKVKNPGVLQKYLVNYAISVEAQQRDLFKKLTVKEVIWGYEDDLLKSLKTLEPILSIFGFKIPHSTWIVLQRNGSDFVKDIGNITVLTGAEDTEQVAKVVRWRGLDNSPHLLTKYGRMLNGSDGSRVPPFSLSPHKRLYGFFSQTCRSMYSVYKEDVKLEGIPLYRFTNTESLLMNRTMNPDNGAFCTDNVTCWKSGLLPLSTCSPGGPPIFMSFPHFYLGDSTLAERIDGLLPNVTLHGSYGDFEPMTGYSMRGMKRIQVNVMAQKSWLDISRPFQHHNNFLPIFTAEEAVAVDSRSAAKFRKFIFQLKAILGYLRQFLLALGGIMIFLAFILLLSIKYNLHERTVLFFLGPRRTRIFTSVSQ